MEQAAADFNQVIAYLTELYGSPTTYALTFDDGREPETLTAPCRRRSSAPRGWTAAPPTGMSWRGPPSRCGWRTPTAAPCLWTSSRSPANEGFSFTDNCAAPRLIGAGPCVFFLEKRLFSSLDF